MVSDKRHLCAAHSASSRLDSAPVCSFKQYAAEWRSHPHTLKRRSAHVRYDQNSVRVCSVQLKSDHPAHSIQSVKITHFAQVEEARATRGAQLARQYSCSGPPSTWSPISVRETYSVHNQSAIRINGPGLPTFLPNDAIENPHARTLEKRCSAMPSRAIGASGESPKSGSARDTDRHSHASVCTYFTCLKSALRDCGSRSMPFGR